MTPSRGRRVALPRRVGSETSKRSPTRSPVCSTRRARTSTTATDRSGSAAWTTLPDTRIHRHKPQFAPTCRPSPMRAAPAPHPSSPFAAALSSGAGASAAPRPLRRAPSGTASVRAARCLPGASVAASSISRNIPLAARASMYPLSSTTTSVNAAARPSVRLFIAPMVRSSPGLSTQGRCTQYPIVQIGSSPTGRCKFGKRK